MRRSVRLRVWLVVFAVGTVSGACGSGESVLLSGNAPTATSTTVPAASTSNGSSGDGVEADGTVDADPVATVPATTVPSDLDEFPRCPVDALDDASGSIEILFWHGLTASNEAAIVRVVDEYNASQDRVRVIAQSQGGYSETIGKYYQSGVSARPQVVMFPEYMVQQTVDSESVIPVGACVEASGFDTAAFQPSALTAYSTGGVLWGMPFNVSNPVLYYNRAVFERAGLDPDRSPTTLEELREFSEVIVSSGAASYGIALDSGTDSGGGWFLEQWFANAGEYYADNGNGRLAPATRVLYDGPVGVELLTYVQQLIADGLAFNVGDNPNGTATFLKLTDQVEPAAMTIGTSAALSTVLSVVDAGMIAGATVDDLGIGPLPGPGPVPTALVGGAAVYVVDGHGDEQAAAAWDFVQYLVAADVQSLWATVTGYVPVRSDALDLEPVASVYEQDPRFRVAYDQLVGSPDDPALQGPILGPQREVRTVTARAVGEIFAGADVQESLAAAAALANALLADYGARN